MDWFGVDDTRRSIERARIAIRGEELEFGAKVAWRNSNRRIGLLYWNSLTVRIWNEQLVRYAGYQRTDGTVLGDPRIIGITSAIRALGWPGGPGTPFDVLPLVVEGRDGVPHWFTVPADAVLEVTISHPELPWFAELGLRWYAVPAISNLCLEIDGICYGAAPFNGW